uniref:Uncharacterized protein n=1 Tax=Knipowitschia caucasica TaxID=637954 RepID=A0AAV2L6B7_KNICA
MQESETTRLRTEKLEKNGDETRDLLHTQMEKIKIQVAEIERLEQKSEEDHAAFQAALKQKDCETEAQQQSLQQAVGSLQTQYTELIETFLSYRSYQKRRSL